VFLAAGVALAALTVSAGAEPTRFGELSITPLPTPDCASAHGYLEYRFSVQNRSATNPHEVTITLPYESYGEDAGLVALSRSVAVAPGATVTVSLPQCGIVLQGSEAAIAVDGRRQREPLRVNLESHGIGRYMRGSNEAATLILTSRGVPFPAPGEEDPFAVARAEQDVCEWSAEWLAYTRYDGVAVSAEEVERMPPPVRQALVRYVECGGSLEVVGPWKPPQDWQKADHYTGPTQTYAVGFGVCFVGPNRAVGDPAHSPLLKHAGETAIPFREIRSVEKANREVPVVEDIRVPVRGMLILMLAFVVVIGPVNLLLLGRLNKRIWLLVTVPALSLLTGVLMFGYSVVSEGFKGHCRMLTLTLLDETTGRATSLGWAAYYSPLATREGLHFSYQTELTPQIAEDEYSYGGYAAPSGGRTVDWTQDQHLASGWLAARVPVHFMFRKSEVRRERLAVRTDADGKVTVVNGLGVPIKKLALADREGRVHRAENIAAGAEVAMKAWDRSAADFSLRNAYKGAWQPLIVAMAAEPHEYLKPLTYVAVLDASPFTDNAMPAADPINSLAVVYGRLGGRTDGN
jgi:hypothetical protein